MTFKSLHILAFGWVFSSILWYLGVLACRNLVFVHMLSPHFARCMTCLQHHVARAFTGDYVDVFLLSSHVITHMLLYDVCARELRLLEL